MKVIGPIAVVSTSQKTKPENVRQRECEPTFPVRLMQKDFGMIMRLAEECTVPMPAAAFRMVSVQKVRDA